MSDFTPGPWEVIGNPPTEIGAMMDTPDAIVVADTRLMHGTPTPRQLADARLIAAAPDLLAALDRFLGDECECGQEGVLVPCAYCQGWAAIAKAGR